MVKKKKKPKIKMVTVRAPEIRSPFVTYIFKLATIVCSKIIQALGIIYAIKLITNAVL